MLSLGVCRDPASTYKVAEFRYLAALFASERNMEQKIDKQIRASSAVICRSEEGAHLKGEALNLSVNLCSKPHLWPQALG